MQSIQPVNIGPADNHGNYFSPFFWKRVAAGHFWRLSRQRDIPPHGGIARSAASKWRRDAPDPAPNCNHDVNNLGPHINRPIENQAAGPLRL